MPESRLRAIVHTAVDGIILMDGGGRVTMFNRACEQMFGYPAEEIVGGDVKRLMPEPYHDQHDQYLDNYRRTRQRKIIGIGRQVVGRRKNGETFPLDLSVGEAEQGGEVFYVGILRDVTERERAIRVRELLIEQLTASNEERGHFAHVASHDLREPLRMVSAFSRLLAQDYGESLDERGREYLSLVVSATGQMQELLDDLVDFGRLGSEAERASWFSTGDSIALVLETLGDPIKESSATILVDDLPRIHGNPIRFQRLMQNLIGNALKYVAEGIEPRIQVSAAKENGFWRFSVSDNGIGIDAHHHEQIFEPFKRLHGKSRYHGTGLGLAICRKIVAGFGGAIRVSSCPGKGSTFSFTVKIQPDEGDNDQRNG
jgi:two-component system sensor kinase FixL